MTDIFTVFTIVHVSLPFMILARLHIYKLLHNFSLHSFRFWLTGLPSKKHRRKYCTISWFLWMDKLPGLPIIPSKNTQWKIAPSLEIKWMDQFPSTKFVTKDCTTITSKNTDEKEINNHCKTEPIDFRELVHDKEKTIPVKIRSTEGISLGAL